MSIHILFLQAFILCNLNVNWLFQCSEEPEFYLEPLVEAAIKIASPGQALDVYLHVFNFFI